MCCTAGTDTIEMEFDMDTDSAVFLTMTGCIGILVFLSVLVIAVSSGGNEVKTSKKPKDTGENA